MDFIGPWGFKLKLGPTVSESSSNPQTNSAQTSVQGSAGASSPTVVGGGNVSYVANDPQLQLQTVQALANEVQTALNGASGLSNQALTVAQQSAATQSADQAQILSNALAAEQSLASYQGSGGAIQQSDSTKYIIYGALALGALAIGLALSRK